MSLPVIPAPVRFDRGAGQFTLRPGTTVGYTAAGIAPIAERFCTEITRRTGVQVTPAGGDPGPGEPSVRIELATGDDLAAGDGLAALPAPRGISPAGDLPPDERYSLAIEGDRVVLRAAEPAGAARGLATFVQILAAGPSPGGGELRVPCGRILDGPGYAWRGLSLDLARAFFTPGEVRRVVDLIALYKLNVLHLHLTDDQAWRLPTGRPAGRGGPGGAGYSADIYGAEDLRALVGYAADRFVTIVPEVDMPGHALALAEIRPELASGRNQVEAGSPPGQVHRTVWLDPELPATFEVVREVLADVAAIFPGPYMHIGGDEPRGMPRDLYASFVDRTRGLVRSLGRRPVGWQETVRAGLGPEDVIQYWLAGIAVAASSPPRVRAQIAAELADSGRDVEAAVAASVPVIVSPARHCYLDVPYAEPSADPAQAGRQARVGLRLYEPITIAESFDWEPAGALGPGRAAHVAGVEAAVWAETISGFGDLSFLLLPRLPGIAHKAWAGPTGPPGPPGPRAVTWADHRDRLARHGRLWEQDNLEYFRAPTLNWA
jgi:hexosaminidase